MAQVRAILSQKASVITIGLLLGSLAFVAWWNPRSLFREKSTCDVSLFRRAIELTDRGDHCEAVKLFTAFYTACPHLVRTRAIYLYTDLLLGLNFEQIALAKAAFPCATGYGEPEAKAAQYYSKYLERGLRQAYRERAYVGEIHMLLRMGGDNINLAEAVSAAAVREFPQSSALARVMVAQQNLDTRKK